MLYFQYQDNTIYAQKVARMGGYMKKLRRRFSALFLSLVCVLSCFSGIKLTATAEETTFLLFFYYEGSETLIMDIWNHTGLEFSDDTETEDTFGWGKNEGILQAVEGNENWYVIDLNIVADTDDGFDIYAGSSSANVGKYDTKWNNADAYATLVSGEYSEYGIYNWTVYTPDSECDIDIPFSDVIDDATGDVSEDDADDVSEDDIDDASEDSDDDLDDENVTDDEGDDETQVVIAPSESDIYVERNAAIDDDFYLGADISSYYSLIKSGVKFKDFDGNELDEVGFFSLLKAGGTNFVRIRVWNNPYDAEGNTYGGGGNDLEAAIEMGKWATEAGLKVLIDFHYSDFWADPGKQMVPKAWSGKSVDELATAISEYTADSLTALLRAGVNVQMIQIGNETTNSLCGVYWSDTESICKLFKAGADAVRNINENIEIAIHFTNPNSKDYVGYAKKLEANGVDYDIFASSYYPNWHGSLTNLTSKLKAVADTYNKKVMVAETSWAYTLEDGDGHENTVRNSTKSNQSGIDLAYSVQGQATELAAVAKAVTDVGDAGVGVFWWEAAWIPVAVPYDEEGNLDSDKLSENKVIWEQYGSGWATSVAYEYQPDDVGEWYGGSAVDNQAWFDFYGNPLETLNVYNYLKTGTTAETPIADEDTTEGTDSDSGDEDLDNLIVNGGFEDGDTAWTFTGGCYVEAKNDYRSGSKYLHFYTGNDGADFTATQTVTLDKGIYEFAAYLEGGNGGDTEFKISAEYGDTALYAESSVSSWKEWTRPTIFDITITEDGTEVKFSLLVLKTTSGVWGSFDDVTLYKTGEYETSAKETEDASSSETASSDTTASETTTSETTTSEAAASETVTTETVTSEASDTPAVTETPGITVTPAVTMVRPTAPAASEPVVNTVIEETVEKIVEEIKESETVLTESLETEVKEETKEITEDAVPEAVISEESKNFNAIINIIIIAVIAATVVCGAILVKQKKTKI